MNFTAKENGTYKLASGKTGFGAGSSIVYVSGDLGGGTAKFAYVDSIGMPIDLIDGEVEPNKQYVIEHGSVISPVLIIEGADGSLALRIIVTAKV